MVVNRRLLMAAQLHQMRQQQGGSGRGLNIGPVTAYQAQPVMRQAQFQEQRNQYRQAAGQQAAARGNTINWQALMDQSDILHGTRKPPESGGGGLLGNILGNSLVKGVLKPLELLQVPGKAVLSTIKESSDLLAGQGFSGKDWVEQFKDPSFGYGKIVGDLTGNEWLDRAIGFAGDVITDPLTYLTLGSSKLAGAAGRAELAVQGVKQGLEHGVTEELLTKAGRVGENLLSNTEREALGLTEKPGLMFKVPFGQEYRIPGTEGLARGGSAALYGLRSKFTDTALGDAMRFIGVGRDPELRGAYEAIAKGGTDVMDTRRAANLIRETKAGRVAERYLSGKVENEANKLADRLGGKTDFTHAYEMGTATGPEADRVRVLSEFLRTEQGKHNINVGDIRDAKTTNVREYLPHIHTDESEALLGRVEHDLGGRATKVNSVEGEAQNFARAFEVGKKYKIGGKVFEPKIGSIQEVNAWSKANLGIKMLEDDPGYLIARMTEDATSAVGKAARVNELMTGAREVGAATDPLFTQTRPIVNEARATEVEKQLAATQAAGTGQRAAVDKLTPLIKQRVQGAIEGVLTSHRGLDSEARQALRDANANVRGLENAQERVMATADKLFADGERKVNETRAALDQAVSAREGLERQVRGDRRSVYGQALQAQMEREAGLRTTLRETEGVVRERDLVRRRLSRAVESHTTLARADEALQGGLQGRLEGIVTGAQGEAAAAKQTEDVAPFVEGLGAREAAAPPAVEPPAPTAAQITDPEKVKAVQAKVEEFRGEADRLETTLRQRQRGGGAGRLPEEQVAGVRNRIEQLRNQANAGEAAITAPTPELVPTNAAVPGAPPTEPTPPSLTSPLEEQLAGINEAAAKQVDTTTQEAAASAATRAQSMAGRNRLVDTKAQLDRLFGQRTEARTALGTEARTTQSAEGVTQQVGFDEAVRRRMAPFEENVRRQQTSADAATQQAAAHHEQATSFYDAIPDAIQGDLDAIAPAMHDAKAAQAIATTNLPATAQAVKDTGARLTQVKAIPTTPLSRGKFDSYEALGNELRAVAGSDLDPQTKMMLDLHGRLVTQMAKSDADEALMGKMLTDIRDGKLDTLMERIPADGFQYLRSSNLINGQDKIISTAMQTARENYKRVARQDPGMFGKVVDAYTKFFKNWATATPGFHIRNAMAATFMNMTEGVSFREMLDGRQIWRAFRDDPMGDWVAKLPAHLQPNAEDVVKAVYGSGAGGRYTAAELGNRAFGERQKGPLSKLSENRVTKYSHNVGERVEGEVRAGLALNDLNQGGSVSRATARISRVHFDYSDVNEWDASMRRIIPFWTFTSRNIPLQVQQMWLKPRTYVMYEHLKQNFNVDPEGRAYMPDYLKGQGSFRIAGGLVAAPDIGSNQLEQQIANFATPTKLLSQVNPIFKVPAQLATNQDFYYGNKYKANDFQSPGWDTTGANQLLQLLGVGESTPAGPAIERKYLDAVRDLNPITGQLNRLMTTTADREGKGWQSLLNFIGVPLKMVSPETPPSVIRNQRYQSTHPSADQARQRALQQFAASQ